MQKEHLIILIVIAIAALITLGYVFILFKKVSQIKIENQKVEEISKHIFDGAMTFLKREFKIIIPFIIAFAVMLALLGFIPALAGKAEAVGWQSALCFLVGATFSGIAGWVG